MPTTLGLTCRFRPVDGACRRDNRAADSPFPMLAFSATGCLAGLIGCLGLGEGGHLVLARFALIAGAPALAAAATLLVARTWATRDHMESVDAAGD